MSTNKPFISVVIPIYCCEETVEELCVRLKSVLSKIHTDYEIILINDHSPAADWEIIQKLCAEEISIKGINLSRNFGQHYAITAGLHNSSGEWVVVMDGDLEDAPEDIELLYKKAQEGYEIVYARYDEKNKPFLITFFSNLYHKVFNFLVNNKKEKGNARFVIINRKVVDAYNSLYERKRHFGPLLHTLGFREYQLPITAKKVENHSSYTFIKKCNLAITSMISHSTILLRSSILIGLMFSLCSFALGAYLIAQKLLGYQVKLGWSSIIVSIYFVSGLMMIFAGVLGMYIESIIYEVKKTPLYIIRDKLNL